MKRVFLLVVLFKITRGPVVIWVGAICITLHRKAQWWRGTNERRESTSPGRDGRHVIEGWKEEETRSGEQGVTREGRRKAGKFILFKHFSLLATRLWIKERLTFRLAARAKAPNVKHGSVICIHLPLFLIIIQFRTFESHDYFYMGLCVCIQISKYNHLYCFFSFQANIIAIILSHLFA